MAGNGMTQDILPGGNPPRPVLQVMTEQAASERYRLQTSVGACDRSNARWGENWPAGPPGRGGIKWNPPHQGILLNAVSSGMSGPPLSYASAAPSARHGLNTSITPIADLSPYLNDTEWTIQARVTLKPPVRTWCKSKKKRGKVLNVNLEDYSGEIKATIWNEAAVQYAAIFKLRKVYYISRGYLKEANKRYSGGIKNDYTLIFTNETKVVAADQLNNLANIENGVVNPFFGEGFSGHAVIKQKRKVSAAAPMIAQHNQQSKSVETDCVTVNTTGNTFAESSPTEDETPATKRRKMETATEDSPVKTVELGQEDLKYLHSELHPVREKWYSLGVQLQVPTETLKCIQKEHLTMSDCLLEMLTFCLKRTNPPLTQEALAKALESPPLAERNLAKQLRKTYRQGKEEKITHISATSGPSPPGPLPATQGDSKSLQAEADEPMDLQTAAVSTPISPEQQQFQTEPALEPQPSRKRSRQEDGSEACNAKKPKRSTTKKSKVRMRRSPCGKCIGCQPIKKEDCGECVACRDKVKFEGSGRRKKACIYQECQKLKYTSKNPGKVSSTSGQFKRRCGKCIGCLRKEGCGQCKACKGKKKFGGDGKSHQPCRYRICQKLKYVQKGSKKHHPPLLGPSATQLRPTGKVSQQEIKSEASSAKEQKQSTGNGQNSSGPVRGGHTSQACSVLPKGPENSGLDSMDPEKKGPESKIPEKKDTGKKSAESKGSEKKGPKSKGPEKKGPKSKGPEKKSHESKNPENKGPEVSSLAVEGKIPENGSPEKEPGGKGPESKITEGDSKIPNRKGQRRPRCRQCIGCLQKDNCGQCNACRKKVRGEGQKVSHQTCMYRECQKLKYTLMVKHPAAAIPRQSKRCGKCIGCLQTDDCCKCEVCKSKKFGETDKPCIYRACQKVKYTPEIPVKTTASADSNEQSPQEAVSTVHTPTIDLTPAAPQQQPGVNSLHTVTYHPVGQPTRKQSQLEHICDASSPVKQQQSSRNDLESNDSKKDVPELKGLSNKGLDDNLSERKDPESKGPKVKGADGKGPEKKASKKDTEKKKRQRCGQCIGCLQKDDCGECEVCRDKLEHGEPGKKRQPCIYRACQMLKYATAAPIPKQCKNCGKCIGCVQKEDCGKCKACKGKKKFGVTDNYYKQCIYRACQKVKYTPKIPVKSTTSAAAQRPEVSEESPTVLDEMSPHALVKNTQDATSNSGAHIPTNSKLYADASGPGVTTSGEHAVTTTESVATTDHTRNDASAPIVVVERGKGASANQELTKEHDSSLATHNIAGLQDDDLDTRPTLLELVKFPTRNGTINIPKEIGEHYEIFGIVLLNDEHGERVEAIIEEKARANCKEINFNLAILKKWLHGEGEQPATWRTLVQVLKDSDLNALAEQIEAAKSSPIL